MLSYDRWFIYLNEGSSLTCHPDLNVVSVFDVIADVSGESYFEVYPAGLVDVGNIFPIALTFLDDSFGKHFFFNCNSRFKHFFSGRLNVR